MRTARLSTLLAGAGVGTIHPSGHDAEILGLAADSRVVRNGDLFFALRGSRADGAAFAGEALARGARAIVAGSPKPRDFGAVAWVRVDAPRRAMALIAREWHERPDAAMTLVGITGTNGKTSVSYYVEAIARAAGRSAGRIGTVSYAFADREVPAERTTPDATEFYDLLARMRDAGTEIVAMEVSSHALALDRVAGARFQVAAFLNLGRDHLDFHGTVERYFEAKALLFERLEPDHVAVLPADDSRGRVLEGRTRARVVTFGRGAEATVRIVREEVAPDGVAATLRTPDATFDIASALTGRFNLDNAAAAAACGLALGLSPSAVAEGIASLRSIPGRLERVEAGQPFRVLVDYAHTEEALTAVLAALRETTPGRIGLVFGCGGERDHGKRPGMGRAASDGSDAVWITSDNPRGEAPETIIDDILAGVPSGSRRRALVRVEPDRRRAIALAIDWAEAGDAVLIAGKGHETTQAFPDRIEPFDDRGVAREVLAARGWSRR